MKNDTLNTLTPMPTAEAVDEALLRCVIENRSPEDAVRTVYTLISRPVIAFDTTFRLIGYGFPRPFPFAPWEEIAQKGFLSDIYIRQQNALFNQEIMYASGHSTLFNTRTTVDFPQVCGPILQGRHLYGYAGICIGAETEAPFLSYVNDRLLQTLAILLSRSEERSGIRSFRSSQNVSVLSDEQLLSLAESRSPAFAVGILTSVEGTVPTLHYVKSRLEHSSFPSVVLIENETDLFILFYALSSKESQGSLRGVSACLTVLAQQFDLIGGISDFFTLPQQVFTAKLQAETARAFVRRDLCDYRVAPFRAVLGSIASHSAAERFGPELDSFPIMKKIHALQSVEENSLLATLRAYLQEQKNKKQTAEKLGVHVNTVSYRLQRISEITNTDFSDPENLELLRIGLLLLESY